ncbi:hypothetical protein BH18GEM1_BH18GEM1_16950 [soil metagenome]
MLVITEPATMATDYLLAAFSLAWGWLLWCRGAEAGSVAIRWWAGGFFAVATAAAAGGTVHGFRSWLGSDGEAALWTASLWAIGLFAFCALSTAAAAGARPRNRVPLQAAAAILLAAYLGWTWTHDEFRSAIAAYGLAMVLLVAQQAYSWARWRAPAAPWILAGVAVAMIGSVVQQTGLSLHEHLNHNDLYHVLQIGAGGLFYRGGTLLADRRAE